MLGDLGADIIRVQNEEHSTLVNRPDYPYYFVWGRSKRSVSLDMKHPEALNAIRKLIENCDVLIENYSAGVLDSWGLDWETVKKWNPAWSTSLCLVVGTMDLGVMSFLMLRPYTPFAALLISPISLIVETSVRVSLLTIILQGLQRRAR